ncbi:unnamed protein product, partial [Mesorhabditis spiculigera]
MARLFQMAVVVAWMGSTWAVPQENRGGPTNRLSFWPGVSWQPKENRITADRRSPTASALSKLQGNPDLNFLRDRLTECYRAPESCKLDAVSKKGADLLRKMHEELEIEWPPMSRRDYPDIAEDSTSGAVTGFDPQAPALRPLRLQHSHYLYNPHLRLQALAEQSKNKFQ